MSAEVERRRPAGGISDAAPSVAPLTEAPGAEMFHVASAIVIAWPRACPGLADRIAALAGTEVWHVEGSRIIVVIEASNEGAIRGRLAEIAAMREALSVNFVFEHSERVGLAGDEP